MKKIHFLFALLFISLSSFAGGNEKYQQIMGKTLSGYAEARSPQDFQALANRFDRIAKAEKEEWLPRYYHAPCLIIQSFITSEGPERKDEILDLAEQSLKEVMDLVPEESEAYALQAFFYTARLTVDPGTRGMEYSMLSNQSIGKSLRYDPENRRARYLKIANDMGAAPFFGKDPAAYCPDANALYEAWDEVQAPSPLHPSWGKRDLKELMSSCN